MTDKTITVFDDEPIGELDLDSSTEEAAAQEAEAQAPLEPEEEIDHDQQTEELKAENLELREQVKRTAAEFQNFRRRQEEEAKRVKLRLREDLVRTMLPIFDNMDRTLVAAQQGGDGALDALLKGLELVDKDIKKIFEDLGLQPIQTAGELFDPALHEAVMMQETDEVPDQTILLELQKGYTLGDRVIRPSMVQVARNSST